MYRGFHITLKHSKHKGFQTLWKDSMSDRPLESPWSDNDAAAMEFARGYIDQLIEIEVDEVCQKSPVHT